MKKSWFGSTRDMRRHDPQQVVPTASGSDNGSRSRLRREPADQAIQYPSSPSALHAESSPASRKLTGRNLNCLI